MRECLDDEGGEIQALDRWRNADTPEARRVARKTLREATESPRSKILTRFNALPQGVKFLVDLRRELIPLAKLDPELASLDDDLEALLTAWFDPDLELHRISWDTASGALLEKFMAYEAVHPVENWTDLKDRLDYDRRYFAIFYSISNAQEGLAGVSFGGFLIKRVVEELAREFPELKSFATLSPLPGFRRWLEKAPSALLLPSEEKKLKKTAAETDLSRWFLDVVAEAGWLKDPDLEKPVRPTTRTGS